jgi:hypothetical protein
VPGERVAVGEVAVGDERHLLAAVGRPNPWVLDRDAATTERHLARLVAVADGAALRVVLAPPAHDIGDLLLHQLGHDAEPDTDRERQQPLLRGAGQLAERLLHPLRQLRRLRAGRHGGDPINQYLLHGGSSCLEWTSITPDAPKRSGRGRRDRRLKFYALRECAQTVGGDRV